MKFTVVSIEKQGVVHVATTDNLTAADVDPAGKNPLESLLGVTWSNNRVLINFGKTSYVDSCAIGWLIATNRAIREGGGKLAIYNVQPAVRQLMDTLKIGKAVTIADSETKARASLVEKLAA